MWINFNVSLPFSPLTIPYICFHVYTNTHTHTHTKVNNSIYRFSQSQKKSSRGNFGEISFWSKLFLAWDRFFFITGQRKSFKNHVTSISCKPESAIQSCDAGQRIPCFDSSQLITTRMSNIKTNTICNVCKWVDVSSNDFVRTKISGTQR